MLVRAVWKVTAATTEVFSTVNCLCSPQLFVAKAPHPHPQPQAVLAQS